MMTKQWVQKLPNGVVVISLGFYCDWNEETTRIVSMSDIRTQI